MLELSDHLRASLPAGDQFDAILRLNGETFREQKNRRTFRSTIGGRSYFVKIHGPTSWREILKNASRGRWPVLTAKPEMNAIRQLEKLGIQTVRAAGFGCRGRFPHALESFIITEELHDMIHLSELPELISHSTIPAAQSFHLKRQITLELARISRILHTNGLNHRDYYLNHFMLKNREWSQWRRDDNVTLHLIDLHRMQIRTRTPRRWAIKDISGLLFSAFDASLTTTDCVRFLNQYWNEDWRARWRQSQSWRAQVLRRAISLYRSERGKSPPRLAGLTSSP
jgi:heptose I phosphotransferase